MRECAGARWARCARCARGVREVLHHILLTAEREHDGEAVEGDAGPLTAPLCVSLRACECMGGGHRILPLLADLTPIEGG